MGYFARLFGILLCLFFVFNTTTGCGLLVAYSRPYGDMGYSGRELYEASSVNQQLPLRHIVDLRVQYRETLIGDYIDNDVIGYPLDFITHVILPIPSFQTLRSISFKVYGVTEEDLKILYQIKEKYPYIRIPYKSQDPNGLNYPEIYRFRHYPEVVVMHFDHLSGKPYQIEISGIAAKEILDEIREALGMLLSETSRKIYKKAFGG